MKFQKPIAGLIMVIVALILPLVVTDNYIIHLLIMTGIWIILSTSFNIILSAGQLSLGQIAFWGIGGYTSGILTAKLGVGFIPALLAAGVFSAFVGLLIGRITLKMRGSHFVLVTFAFAAICKLVATNWIQLTNGPMALRGIPAASIRIPGVVDFVFKSYCSNYYLILGFVFLTIYVAYRLRYSRYGRAFNALRSSENLAESVGISHYRFVTVAVLVSTFLTGLAGSLYAHYVQLMTPEIFAFAYMINLLIMTIGGGRNSITGPVVGAIIFSFLPEMLRFLQDFRMLVFGSLLVLIVLFIPAGIVPQVQSLFQLIIGKCRGKNT